MLEKLRADMAGATGINQAGRRKTTAIAVAYGSHKHDPAVKLAKDTVLSWMQLWRGTSRRADCRLAWRKIHSSIIGEGGKIKWGKVTGPLSACIATMTSLGWCTNTAEVWKDPEGTTWSMTADGTKKQVADIIEQQFVPCTL